tara:strand:- start:388 stop:2706 length:2319 start_codon:yes stop_codon:yes gene_type:complete
MNPSKKESIGNKAYSLLILKEKGFNIPHLETFSVDEIKKLDFEDLVEKILLKIKDKNKMFILRSSAIGEDGEETSFAGIFESVKIKDKEDIKNGLKIIFNSFNSDKLNSYLKLKNINEKPKLAIILQEFVEGDVSGVLFSLKNEYIINSNHGSAESVVQGESCDEYIIDDKNKIINKNLNKDSLSKKEIKTIVDIGGKVNKLFNKNQDIEWTIKDSKIYLLQSRPVTSEIDEQLTVWDNSNIVESYPGIVLPLTCSFAKYIYSEVYKKVAIESGVSKNKIEKYETEFDNMLGFFKGRFYYNMLNWYKILTLFPGYERNKDNFDLMISAQSQSNLDEDYKENVNLFFKIKYYPLVFYKSLKFKSTVNYFKEKTKNLIKDSLSKKYENLSLEEVFNEFKRLRSELIPLWYIPIENDFLAMTYYGLLIKSSEKREISKEDILMELSDIGDLRGSNQIKKIIEISKLANENNEVRVNLHKGDYNKALIKIKNDRDLSENIKDYFLEYGGRFVNELKLETDELKPTSHDFLELLKGYLDFKINKTKRNPVVLKFPLNIYLKKTKHYLRQREDLRILRAQVFSLTRNIFLRIGEIFEKDKVINSKKDIFYLKIKEIEDFICNDYKIDLKDLINSRKEQYNKFKQYSLPSVFYTNKLGKIIIPQKEINEDFKDVINGRPCSVGEITGSVTLIKESKPDLGKNYDIIVTESADPGWAPVLGLCNGIIIEKGGVLSHISILARELGVPCIINASNITKILNNKDNVYMNGGNGKIKIIKNN